MEALLIAEFERIGRHGGKPRHVVMRDVVIAIAALSRHDEMPIGEDTTLYVHFADAQATYGGVKANQFCHRMECVGDMGSNKYVGQILTTKYEEYIMPIKGI